MKNKLITALFGVSLLVGSASAQIVVRIGPPPPPRHEFVPVAPGPGYVLVPGFHQYDGRAYVWVPGHYVVAPRPHARWVPDTGFGITVDMSGERVTGGRKKQWLVISG
jgi:hypothetical protein